MCSGASATSLSNITMRSLRELWRRCNAFCPPLTSLLCVRWLCPAAAFYWRGAVTVSSERWQAQPATPGSGRPPRVLTVLPDFPYPAVTGLHLRMVSNLELVKRLGCYSALLFFSTEEHAVMADTSTPLAGICDEVRHGGRRFAYADRSAAS